MDPSENPEGTSRENDDTPSLHVLVYHQDWYKRYGKDTIQSQYCKLNGGINRFNYGACQEQIDMEIEAENSNQKNGMLEETKDEHLQATEQQKTTMETTTTETIQIVRKEDVEKLTASIWEDQPTDAKIDSDKEHIR